MSPNTRRATRLRRAGIRGLIPLAGLMIILGATITGGSPAHASSDGSPAIYIWNQ
jgi:hypothetical protein